MAKHPEGFVAGTKFASAVDLKDIGNIVSSGHGALKVECAGNGIKLKVNDFRAGGQGVMIDEDGKTAAL